MEKTMDDLFTEKNADSKYEPLAVRMRPCGFEEYAGQDHIIGKGRMLRRAIEADRITSLIFYGPPGCGKTALGYLICRLTNSHFERLNAVSSNVQDVRKVLDKTKRIAGLEKRKTILLIDEIHRFNKAQQDVLMPDVESGNPVLIGTTTQNPFFAINPALLSRSQVHEFNALSKEDTKKMLLRALKDKEKGLGKEKVKIDADAIDHLCEVSGGDARKALNALEIGVLTTKKDKNGTAHFNLEAAEESIQKQAVIYDRDGDQHYDTASAFIKSMRGSDPDAALYWMAKMIVAGEDPRFIARRIVICAAEDVGNADPHALILANSAFQISEFIGMPEARIPLAQAAIYVACAPKSNSCYMAIDSAIEDVKTRRTQNVPNALKDASYKGAKRLGRGKDYKYAHDYRKHYVPQEYMPFKKQYYFPGTLGYENKIKQWMEFLKKNEE